MFFYFQELQEINSEDSSDQLLEAYEKEMKKLQEHYDKNKELFSKLEQRSHVSVSNAKG